MREQEPCGGVSDDLGALPPAVVIGESLVDIVHSADGAVSELAGCSCANVAVALARLARPTLLGTSYGFDRLGRTVDRYLAGSGVPVRGRMADPSVRTSSAVARLDQRGAASYEFDIAWRVDVDALPAAGIVVHTGSIAAVLPPGADQVLRYVTRMRPTATISYDVNARPALFGKPDDARRSVEALVRLSDLVKASDEDVSWLFAGWSLDRVAQRWLGMGAAAVVITRGSEGSTCFARSGTTNVASERVSVADTIAAGDTFSAALIDALWVAGLLGAESRHRVAAMSSEHWHRVLTYASRLASITVSRRGADPPHLADLPAGWRAALAPSGLN